MSEHEHWRNGPQVGTGWDGERSDHRNDGGSIERLETALARIATAAGRRQDALRVAELTARAAQHEADLLMQAEEQRRHDQASSAAAEAADQERDRVVRLRDTADRLDALISHLRSEIEEQSAGD